MPCSKEELEQRERQTLASYAQFSADTRGRLFPEAPPSWRTEFQRDRDRVIHTRAFRRLEYKTQVFLNGTGDHLRTRLTHTIEVAAMARGLARALRLNEDLAETIALAHDLGHSPFGHMGERVLNRLMREHGGFEHNRQSLRIVEELEQKYPGFRGLNLSWEVREGLIKHQTSYDQPGLRKEFSAKSPSLEAQIANVADELIYTSHDLDDGLDASLLSEAELERKTRVFAQAARTVRKEHGELPAETRRYFIIRCIIDIQVRDVVETSEAAILASGVKTADDVRRQPRSLIRHSPARRTLNTELRRYLFRNLYSNPAVAEPNRRAGRMLEDLFDYFLAHSGEIGESSRKRASKAGWHRAICDYISGMTDRYTIREHQRLFGQGERVAGNRSL
ncbi:MAG TPA: deoxyguanosinetriphosphate triphosphohydrolase [Candidatus Baltobacteraceae bacterium]|jgi:dGTPase|nr:deoxyguanosinetriphosphate triphosphohydrolase [Candidatus Baltobacteraceae bacterium]